MRRMVCCVVEAEKAGEETVVEVEVRSCFL